MTQFVTLDEVAHADLRVEVGYADSKQALVNQTLVFPTEFIQLAKEYPIFFRRSDEGKFYAIVLLGLDREENLYLQGAKWNARYVPAVIERGPFALAMVTPSDAHTGAAQSAIQIDTEDARVSRDHGERR